MYAPDQIGAMFEHLAKQERLLRYRLTRLLAQREQTPIHGREKDFVRCPDGQSNT